MRYATCCGWENLQELDAVSGIRPWEETTELLERGMPVIDPHIDSAGWNWNENHGLWTGPDDRKDPAG